MGGSCSSPMADLTLAYREYLYMKKIIKSKFGLAELLSNNSRYIDDINIINFKNFASIVKDIYPSDLKVERSGNNNKIINYLDVTITISQDKVETTVYNKHKSFNFPVISYTFPSGNIPLELGLNIFYGQILRFCRICSSLNNLIDKSGPLIVTFRERGYDKFKLKKYMRKVFNKNNLFLFKFGYNNLTNLFYNFDNLFNYTNKTNYITILPGCETPIGRAI